LSANNLQSGESSFIQTYKAELILLIVTFSWGLSFPLIKISLQFISPVLFVFIRFLITIVIFYFLFRKKLDLKNFKKWEKGIILGFFLFLGFALQTLGLKHTTASKSAFITGTALIVIPFAQYFILKTKPKTENIAGAVIVMTGLYILSEAYFLKPNLGDVLTLFCAFCFAIHIVLLNRYTTADNFNYLAFGQFLTMTVMSFIFMIVFEIFIYDELFFIYNSTLFVTLLYTSIFSTLVSIILVTKYQQMTTPLRAGIIYNMESIFAVFFAFIILNEFLNFSQIIGAIIMITGLLISEFYSFIKFKLSYGNKD